MAAAAFHAPAARIILASGSPRRHAILTGLGVEFEVVKPEVEELSEGDPDELVVENARRKARAGLEQSASVPDRATASRLVIACDTDVALDGSLLGKAAGEAQARRHLEALSGRTHEVLSGLVVAPAGGRTDARLESRVVRSRVAFKTLDGGLLNAYLRSGEWRGKAGAYAIQGLGSMLVERIEGDFSNIVGLPLGALRELIPALFASFSHNWPKP